MTPELNPLELLAHAVWRKAGIADFRLTAAVKASFEKATDQYRHAVFEGLAAYPGTENEMSYIRRQQAAVTCLMDDFCKMVPFRDLHPVSGDTEEGLYALPGRTFVCERLEKLILFFQKTFPDTQDAYAPAPLYTWARNVNHLERAAAKLEAAFRGLGTDAALMELLKGRISQRLKYSIPMSEQETRYTFQLLQRLDAVAASRPARPDEAICRLLLEVNYNCTRLAGWYTCRLQNMVEALPDDTVRGLALSRMAKETTQVWVITDGALYPSRPSLKRMIMDWTGEEQAYLRLTTNRPQQATAPVQEPAKIQSNLPVAQLACLVRLLVDTQAIASNNQSEVLRIIAQTFTSLRTTEISPESMRSKFYNLDRSAVAGTRDLLLRMVQQSRRLLP